MSDPSDKKNELLELSHELGAEHRQLAILGEGNTSTKLSDESFLVKASGSSLANLAGCGGMPLRTAAGDVGSR